MYSKSNLMASTLFLSHDINIFYNKNFQISDKDDDAEEPYLVLSFNYNVNGERVEHDIIIGSTNNIAECNSVSLRALIRETKSIPLDAMIDLQDEITRERISNMVASSVYNCVGVERLKILQVNVIVEINLEEEDLVFMELDDVEFLRKRRMNLLQKNVNKNMAMVGKEDKFCAICLHEMGVGEELAFTPCIHRFHYACIGRWFEESGFCPLCRFKIDPS